MHELSYSLFSKPIYHLYMNQGRILNFKEPLCQFFLLSLIALSKIHMEGLAFWGTFFSKKVWTNFNQTWHRYFFGEENLSPSGDEIVNFQISINPDTNIKFSWMLCLSTGRINNWLLDFNG